MESRVGEKGVDAEVAGILFKPENSATKRRYKDMFFDHPRLILIEPWIIYATLAASWAARGFSGSLDHRVTACRNRFPVALVRCCRCKRGDDLLHADSACCRRPRKQ